jgi:hypothetical protein
MPIMGISGSDLKNTGWNLAVAAGMTASSAVVAWGVGKLVSTVFDRVSPLDQATSSIQEQKRIQKEELTQTGLGLVAGVGAAWYINSKISASRYALITDPSLGKMFKLGAVQAAVGFLIDWMRGGEAPFCGVLGAGSAVAGHWSRYSYIGFGLLGASAGTHYSQS